MFNKRCRGAVIAPWYFIGSGKPKCDGYSNNWCGTSWHGRCFATAPLWLKHLVIWKSKNTKPTFKCRASWKLFGNFALTGLKLFKKFRDHLRQYKIDPIKEKVQKLDFNNKNRIFSIHTEQKIYPANKVIIASGTKPKKLPVLEKVTQAINPYLFYEVLPLLKISNKKIIIIGAGDAAFDYALHLAKKNNKIFLINRSDKIKALPLLQKKVFADKNIIYKTNAMLVNVLKGQESNLIAKFIVNQKLKNINVDYLIAAIGRSAQKDFYTEKLMADESKLLEKKLLYLIGDVKNAIYRQTTLAVADGIKVAMEIFQEVLHANDYR
jgi:thioredoxin reductase (NADPH)